MFQIDLWSSAKPTLRSNWSANNFSTGFNSPDKTNKKRTKTKKDQWTIFYQNRSTSFVNLNHD